VGKLGISRPGLMIYENVYLPHFLGEKIVAGMATDAKDSRPTQVVGFVENSDLDNFVEW
jgi:hypothetical protein